MTTASGEVELSTDQETPAGAGQSHPTGPREKEGCSFPAAAHPLLSTISPRGCVHLGQPHPTGSGCRDCGDYGGSRGGSLVRPEGVSTWIHIKQLSASLVWAGVAARGSLNTRLHHGTSCGSQHRHRRHFGWDSSSSQGTVLFVVGTLSTIKEQLKPQSFWKKIASKFYRAFPNTPRCGGQEYVVFPWWTACVWGPGEIFLLFLPLLISGLSFYA